MAADPVDLLSQRVAHLEGWKESQERFALQLSKQLDQIAERLSRVEDELKYLDRKWEERLEALDHRWETRFNQQQAFWEQRFKDTGTRFWWLVGLQFTILLAIIGMLLKLAP